MNVAEVPTEELFSILIFRLVKINSSRHPRAGPEYTLSLRHLEDAEYRFDRGQKILENSEERMAQR